jgi:TonB family protein
MTRFTRTASLLVTFYLLIGCASVAPLSQTVQAESGAPPSQTVLAAVQRLKEQTGIDGEPISLDSKDYSAYLAQVRQMIKEKWAYPCVKDAATGRCEYKSAQVVIVFGILKDGRMPGVQIAESSGADIYDVYAVNAIKRASPFPPVPEAMLKGHLSIPVVAAFRYIIAPKEQKP